MSSTVAPEREASAPPGPFPESVPGRLGPLWMNACVAAVGLPWQRRLARAALKVPRIRHWERHFDRLSDAELRTTGLRLRGRGSGGKTSNPTLS
jgi:preprotein translocase subunit SecA